MATFKELRVGSVVYFLTSRDETMDIRQGTVKQGPGMSHAPTPLPGQTANFMAPSVVNVVIELDGQSKDYELQDTAEYTFGGGMLISPNLSSILEEVRSIKAQSLEQYNKREEYKRCIDRCDETLLKWDPKTREAADLDARFKALEEGQRQNVENYNEIKDMFSRMMKKLES